MASSFQRQALQRKLIYAAIIAVLFTAALGWRKGNFKLFGMDVKGVDEQARVHAIREQSRGDVDLLGAIARLATIGSRGAATCLLWVSAMDAQKKNQWNELELYVGSLTKLQPHFITPWLFQSWNLAYNVSVESDRINDKYFYISRGIGLLAKGERQNLNHPDMRWSIGFFNQHKICQSDETNVLRSLSQLSMIPPNERDPGRFWTVKTIGEQEIKEVNLKELEDFCQKHPQLVRRLRESIRRERRSEQLRFQFRCESAEDLVQFLEDNFRVPSLWLDVLPSAAGKWKARQDQLKPLADRFPVLPPRHLIQPYQQPPDDTALTADSQLLDEHDAYQVSRAWYSYSQEPLPKPGKLPGSSEDIVSRVYQRQPRFTTIIFRDFPAQAQRFTAERTQEEGWFDSSGWAVTDWFRNAGDRFANGEPAVIGKQPWGREAWQKTREAWGDFGRANHMLLTEPEQRNRDALAQAFATKYNTTIGGPVPYLRDEDLDADTKEQRFAWFFLLELGHAKHYTNFDFHYNRGVVESKEDAIQARKVFFEALDAQRLRNDEAESLRLYLLPAGIKAWREVLLSNKVFRGDMLIQEQTYQVQLRYLDLYSRLHGRAFKAQAAGLMMMPMQNPPGGGVCPLGLTTWIAPLIEKDWNNPLVGEPFDGNDDEGRPLISEEARQSVLRRLFPSLVKEIAAEAAGVQPPPSPSRR